MLCRPSVNGYRKYQLPSPEAASSTACRGACTAEVRCSHFEYEWVDFEPGERECELHEKGSVDEAQSKATGNCMEDDRVNGWRCCRQKDSIADSILQAASTSIPTKSPTVSFGNVLLMRHAEAPGGGDPADFDVNDCSTQRNLDTRGKQQARDIGAALKAAGYPIGKVYSSKWCRSKDTAALMDVGEVELHDGLGSFYGSSPIVPKGPTLETLNALFAILPIDDGNVTLMVTHYVTIEAITGFVVAEGGLVGYNTKTGNSMLVDPDTKSMLTRH